MDKELKHTTDFINRKIGKKTGFSIPKNYFEEIDDTILSSIITDKLDKQEHFKTPSNYFDTVEDAILKQITIKTPKEIKKVKVISLYQKMLQFIPLTAAASVLLFVSLHYLNTTKTYTFDDITATEISLWYENGYGISNNEELGFVLDASVFDDTDILQSINNQNLEDYLNTIDNTTLLNEIE
ncbi:hypothetical protein [Tenacibaculum salmonis]|uniref:hypothetical protein n=1 Tax=Tenacibaculum sp. P3-BQ1 TaxID=3232310 RepID=UPI0034DE1397